MNIGIAIRDVRALTPTWTTLHIARAALKRGHRVSFIDASDFEVREDGRLTARTYLLPPRDATADRLVRVLTRRATRRRTIPIETLDVLLLRACPLPADLLWFAREAAARGVQVVNDPEAAARVGSKAWLASRTGVPTPPTLVTRSLGSASLFYERFPEGVVVKPIAGAGGRNVSFIPPQQLAQFDAAVQDILRAGRHVVIQPYLPAAEYGEKRVVWMDGEVLGAYLRSRVPGEFRHNLKNGAQPEPSSLSPTELALVARLTPALLAEGIRLAGLDLIGDAITEVNAVNPGGAFQVDRLSGTDVAGAIVDRLERATPRRISSDLERTPWAPSVP